MRKEYRDRYTSLTAALLGVVWVASASGQVGRTIVNVKDGHVVNYGSAQTAYPGACGDGVCDDRAAIQGAIDFAVMDVNAVTNRGGKGAVIFFPEGKYRITGTIVVPHCASLDFVGAGATPYGAGALGIPDSIIAADFDDHGPVVIFSQAVHNRWTDLQLVAHHDSGSGTPSAIFKTAFSPGNAYVSSVTFENVYFNSRMNAGPGARAGVGVMLGATPAESNQSEFSFYRCGFFGLDTGVHVVNDQSVDHVFEMCGATNCNTFLHLEQGGNVSFNVGNFNNCGGDGADDWIFHFGAGGPNPGENRIANVRFEDGSKKFLRVDGLQQVLVESLKELNPGSTSSVLEVAAGSVVFSNCQFKSLPLLRFTTSPNFGYVERTVRFRDCMLPLVPPGATPPHSSTVVAMPPAGLITGTGKWAFQNCTGLFNDKWLYPVPNASNGW